jgi:hypothetical protein
MARYKQIDTSPRSLAMDLEAQLLHGIFEHALNHLLDHEIDLSAFDVRFKNDDIGASAFPPAMLLKVVLLAYSRKRGSGLTYSQSSALFLAEVRTHPAQRTVTSAFALAIGVKHVNEIWIHR